MRDSPEVIACPTGTQYPEIRMSQAEILKSIESHLQHCRNLAVSVGEDSLAYFIDMAISEAQGQRAGDQQLRRGIELNKYRKARSAVRLAAVNDK